MWEYKSGTGRWKNYVNPDTGEESVKNHTLKLVKTWCANHRFSENIPANRMLICLDCGQEVKFVVGLHRLENGRIKPNTPKKS